MYDPKTAVLNTTQNIRQVEPVIQPSAPIPEAPPEESDQPSVYKYRPVTKASEGK